MKAYFLSLGAGLLLGVAYSLLGILLGEQAVPLLRGALSPPAAATLRRSGEHVFGTLPGHGATAAGTPAREDCP